MVGHGPFGSGAARPDAPGVSRHAQREGCPGAHRDSRRGVGGGVRGRARLRTGAGAARGARSRRGRDGGAHAAQGQGSAAAGGTGRALCRRERSSHSLGRAYSRAGHHHQSGQERHRRKPSPRARRIHALAYLKEEVATAKKGWLAEWEKHLDSEEMPINQYRVIRDLMRSVDRDHVIITHDSGGPREQLIPFWETTVPGSYMGWGKSTQLGYGLGITMGAKLAAPEKLCVNIMGDASIGMTGMDIETAARNRIGILTIVFNNGVMAAERDVLQLSTKKYGALTIGGNYTKVAEGLNVAAMRIEKPGDIAPAIKDGVRVTETGAPFLLEVVVKEGYDFSRYPLEGL